MKKFLYGVVIVYVAATVLYLRYLESHVEFLEDKVKRREVLLYQALSEMDQYSTRCLQMCKDIEGLDQ